jgi:osmotically inducible protein OsmC
MPTKHASAVWEGGLKTGKGAFNVESGGCAGPYSFPTRFEGKAGSSPEELLAAAHAACFSMALSAGLEKAGTPATRVETNAACTLEIIEGKPKVSRIALVTRGRVPGIGNDQFVAAAEAAKQNCPVSGAFKGNLEITLDARLE